MIEMQAPGSIRIADTSRNDRDMPSGESAIAALMRLAGGTLIWSRAAIQIQFENTTWPGANSLIARLTPQVP